jgi:hypothetical protein
MADIRAIPTVYVEGLHSVDRACRAAGVEFLNSADSAANSPHSPYSGSPCYLETSARHSQTCDSDIARSSSYRKQWLNFVAAGLPESESILDRAGIHSTDGTDRSVTPSLIVPSAAQGQWLRPLLAPRFDRRLAPVHLIRRG